MKMFARGVVLLQRQKATFFHFFFPISLVILTRSSRRLRVLVVFILTHTYFKLSRQIKLGASQNKLF